MQQINSARDAQEIVKEARKNGKKISLIPTMGALHGGHIALIHRASTGGATRRFTVVSIFVNPTQFNSDEDLKNYPRMLDRDLELCEREGVNLVFTPTEREIYPQGLVTDIPVPAVGRPMEGEFRPGHFAGVCAVVARLFKIIQPDCALFGEKDFQQIRVIEEMVREQKIPVEIVRCPTIRDKNGLALSSRNARLSAEGYQKALAIPRAIRAAQDLTPQGEVSKLLETAKKKLSGLKVDYVTIIEGRIFIAAWVEGIRLIDNEALG